MHDTCWHKKWKRPHAHCILVVYHVVLSPGLTSIFAVIHTNSVLKPLGVLWERCHYNCLALLQNVATTKLFYATEVTTDSFYNKVYTRAE